MYHIEDIVNVTVNTTIAKIKAAGLMKDNKKTAFQKTEELLKDYTVLKDSEDLQAKKIVKKIDDILLEMKNEPYIKIIELYYFKGYTIKSVSEEMGTSTRTIMRNKAKLINKFKLKLFTDDVIYELFL